MNVEPLQQEPLIGTGGHAMVPEQVRFLSILIICALKPLPFDTRIVN